MQISYFNKKINFIFYNIVVVLVVFLIIEVFLKLYFNQTESFNCYTDVGDIRKYTNKKNCAFTERYFEKKDSTAYYTNNRGLRVSGNKSNDQYNNNIYFIGDSFTFGYLSNYQDTYPYNAVQNINKQTNLEYKELNLGVNGYQFKQIIYLLENDKSILDSEDLIIYGLTPNDIFDINETDNNIIQKSSPIDKARNLLNRLNWISIKFLSSKVLKNDDIYIKIYNKRGEKAGYINKEGSGIWDKKYDYFEKEIAKIPPKIRNRLIISIIPQQIQIRLIKKGLIEDGLAFDTKILNICERIKINCISKTLELAKKVQFATHFTVDGHLFPKANREYGKLISSEIIKFLKND
tara:strand:+ start:2401 stop:3447 length:1047 start_codon:yes stop_codon:yes gene_type:complete